MKKDESRKLAALTFFAKCCSDIYGLNGLPITPHSISILGKFQFLKSLKSHDNLCQYLDVVRGKHERTIIVSEYYGRPLQGLNLPNENRDEIIIKIFHQIANGLDYIHQNKMSHHYLEPENILIDTFFNVKLFNYGLFYMTKNGEYVSFPIGSIKYMSPERILGNHGNIKSDVWSLGIVLTELVLNINLWPSLKINQIARKILKFCSGNNVLEKIAREHDCLEIYKNMDPEFKQLLESCLSIHSKDRPLPDDIIKNPFFDKYTDSLSFQVPKKNCADLGPLERCELAQIYYFWQLAGGDIQAELKKEGLIRSQAPILSIPK